MGEASLLEATGASKARACSRALVQGLAGSGGLGRTCGMSWHADSLNRGRVCYSRYMSEHVWMCVGRNLSTG